MKLTNTVRDAFVRAAINDVPTLDHNELIRQVAVDDAVNALPPKIRAIWHDKDLHDYVAQRQGNYGRTAGDRYGVAIYYPGLDDGRVLSLAAEAQVAELARQREAQDETINNLRASLRAAAYSVGTRKALADLLPEFEKYLPADDTAARKINLPAVANIVADFARAGWPKGKAA